MIIFVLILYSTFMKSALILEDLEIPGIGKMRLYLEEGYSESLEEICTYLSRFKIKNIKHTMFNDEKDIDTNLRLKVYSEEVD